MKTTSKTALSATDLQELRERGIFPYSKFATACAAAIGTLGGVSQVVPEWKEFFLTANAANISPAPVYVINRLAELAVKTCVIIPLYAAIAAIVVGLLQSKFLLRIGSRVKSGEQKVQSITASFFRLMGSFLFPVVALCGSTLCFFIFFPASVSLLNGTRISFAQTITAMNGSLVPLLILLSGVVGVLSWFTERWLFFTFVGPMLSDKQREL